MRWGASTEPKGYCMTIPTPTTACSPCSHLTRDTEVSTAVQPDSRAASFLCETPQLILLTPPILIVSSDRCEDSIEGIITIPHSERIFERLEMFKNSWNLAHTSQVANIAISYGSWLRAWQGSSGAPPTEDHNWYVSPIWLKFGRHIYHVQMKHLNNEKLCWSWVFVIQRGCRVAAILHISPWNSWRYIVQFAPNFTCLIRVLAWRHLHADIHSHSTTYWQQEMTCFALWCTPPTEKSEVFRRWWCFIVKIVSFHPTEL